MIRSQSNGNSLTSDRKDQCPPAGALSAPDTGGLADAWTAGTRLAQAPGSPGNRRSLDRTLRAQVAWSGDVQGGDVSRAPPQTFMP